MAQIPAEFVVIYSFKVNNSFDVDSLFIPSCFAFKWFGINEILMILAINLSDINYRCSI